MEIVGRQSVLNELPAGPALFSAGSQHRPDASVPLPAHQGSAALGNSPINNSLTKSLLSSIVGWWNSRVKQKPEHSVTMLAETLSECSRFGWQVLLLGQGQYSILDFEHNPVESVLCDFVSKMPDMKEPLELNQQAISKAFVGLIGASRKKFDVPNQMSQAELLNLVGIFDISTKEIADYCAVVSFSKNISEYLRRPRFGNAEKAECRGAENPYPVFYPLVFPTGLVNIQNRLGWDMLLELLIRSPKSLIDTANGIAKMTSSDIDVQHLTAEVVQSTVGGMQRAFHIADQGLQTQPEQLTFDNASRQFSPDNSSAFGTDKTVQTVFSNGNRIVNKFNGLLNFRLFDWLTTAYIAAVATISVKRDRLVNLILPEWLSIAAFMTRLTTLLRGTAGLFGFRRLDNIRGRRLGRVRGILGKYSYLFSKLSVGFKKFSNLLFQSADPLIAQLQLSFKFSNALFVKLFAFRGQILPLRHLLRILSGERGPPLEEIDIIPLTWNYMRCKANGKQRLGI